MKASASSSHRVTPVLLFGLAYAAVGVLTAGLAGSAQSTATRDIWRLAGWVLSLVVFIRHLLFERPGSNERVFRAAGRIGLAVAIGAFVLAAAGPVRSYWATDRFWRVAVLSLVLWPLLTGIPAFLVALAAGPLHRRVVSKKRQANDTN